MTTMIRPYAPMAPTLVRAPFHRPGWIYEEKVDGYRIPAPTRTVPASAW